MDKLERVKVGGLSAIRATGRARPVSALPNSMVPVVPVQLTWIAYRGDVYRITGMSRRTRQLQIRVGNVAYRIAGTSSIRSQYDGSFRNVARSFRPLRPAARRSIQQKRLHIATARDGESLLELSRRSGNTWDLQQTAVVNGIYTTDSLEPGQLVKVAVAEDYAAEPGRTGEHNEGALQPIISSLAPGLRF